MARTVREEPRKSDNLVFVGFQYCVAWIKANKELALGGAAVVVCIILAGWGYAAFEASKAERAQYALSQGMRSFQQYTVTKNNEALGKAETEFGQVAKIGSGSVRDVARLYLARIALAKGDKEKARSLYSDVAKKSSSDLVRKLAQDALQDLQKK